MLRFAVPHELDGQRLDRFLEWRIPRVDRARAAEIIRACAFLPDGTRRKPSDRVRVGETVLLVRERFVEPETPRDFAIVHEDEALLVLDKPAGLPVHPTATYHRNTLTQLLAARYGERGPQICHRLDRETSGLVVCARPGPDEVKVKRLFESRSVEKTYLAIVRGRVEPDAGVIDRPLRRAIGGLHLRIEAHPSGLPAVTSFEVVERGRDRSLLRLSPRTGRQHQLRVHLSSIGHPIVGDKLYGPEGEAPFLEKIERGMSEALLARLGHGRHALHVHRLLLPHPRTGAPLVVESPLPEDLRALWASGEP